MEQLHILLALSHTHFWTALLFSNFSFSRYRQYFLQSQPPASSLPLCELQLLLLPYPHFYPWVDPIFKFYLMWLHSLCRHLLHIIGFLSLVKAHFSYFCRIIFTIPPSNFHRISRAVSSGKTMDFSAWLHILILASYSYFWDSWEYSLPKWQQIGRHLNRSYWSIQVDISC